MKQFFGIVSICCVLSTLEFSQILGEPRDRTGFKHVSTGKYFSSDGYAEENKGNKELFSVQTTSDGEFKVLYAYPWISNWAMVIDDGCKENSTVLKKRIKFNEREDYQKWIFEEDGTISSPCNEEWRLVLQEDGKQIVCDKNKVKPEDLKWKMFTEFK